MCRHYHIGRIIPESDFQMESYAFIGACGDNCEFCLRYKATVNDDNDELVRIRDLWVSLGWRDPNTDPEEMKCSGCRKENRCAYEELRICVFEKSLKNCGMCLNYPCEISEDVFTTTTNLFASLNKRCLTPKDGITLEISFADKKDNLDRIHNYLFKKGINK